MMCQSQRVAVYGTQLLAAGLISNCGSHTFRVQKLHVKTEVQQVLSAIKPQASILSSTSRLESSISTELSLTKKMGLKPRPSGGLLTTPADLCWRLESRPG